MSKRRKYSTEFKQELIQKITVCGVDFHTIKAGLPQGLLERDTEATAILYK